MFLRGRGRACRPRSPPTLGPSCGSTEPSVREAKPRRPAQAVCLTWPQPSVPPSVRLLVISRLLQGDPGPAAGGMPAWACWARAPSHTWPVVSGQCVLGARLCSVMSGWQLEPPPCEGLHPGNRPAPRTRAVSLENTGPTVTSNPWVSSRKTGTSRWEPGRGWAPRSCPGLGVAGGPCVQCGRRHRPRLLRPGPRAQ